MITILTLFILPAPLGTALRLTVGVIFVILPTFNHVGIFIAIRRHNNEVVDVISVMNASVLLRRETKAATDMLVVSAVLVLCLVPAMAGVLLRRVISADGFTPLNVWSTNLIYFNSAINPIIYLLRNSELRNAVRLMLRC